MNCDIHDLRLPLMALIDYRGFRIIAVSILPIDCDTLVYGSADAGKSIYNNCDEIRKHIEV